MKKFTLIVSVLLLMSCMEDNPVDTIEAPPLPIVGFKGPITTSTHVEAQNVKGQISQFNAFTTSFDAFSLTQPTVPGDTYTWTIREGIDASAGVGDEA